MRMLRSFSLFPASMSLAVVSPTCSLRAFAASSTRSSASATTSLAPFAPASITQSHTSSLVPSNRNAPDAFDCVLPQAATDRTTAASLAPVLCDRTSLLSHVDENPDERHRYDLGLEKLRTSTSVDVTLKTDGGHPKENYRQEDKRWEGETFYDLAPRAEPDMNL